MGWVSRRSVRRTWLAGIILLVAVAGSAPGATIEIADPVFGPASATLDTDTNLVWLDLTHSVGRSFNDVGSQFGSGGDFEGWRHATSPELFLFWEDVGVIPHVVPGEPGGFISSEPAVREWIDLLGETFSNNFDGPGNRGITNTPFEGGLLFYETRLDKCGSLAPPGECNGVTTLSTYLDFDVVAPELGHYLVRVIPEPHAAVLFGVGVLVVGAAVRRRL